MTGYQLKNLNGQTAVCGHCFFKCEINVPGRSRVGACAGGRSGSHMPRTDQKPTLCVVVGKRDLSASSSSSSYLTVLFDRDKFLKSTVCCNARSVLARFGLFLGLCSV